MNTVYSEATTYQAEDATGAETTSFPETAKASLGTIDLVVVVLYIFATFAIGIWVNTLKILFSSYKKTKKNSAIHSFFVLRIHSFLVTIHL